MNATRYLILEAATIKELESLVRDHWAPGHGAVHQSPFVPGSQDAWLYLTFCQAVMS